MDDFALIELLQNDPEAGLCKLMEQYSALVYAVVRGKLAGVCPNADIEECTAEAFSEFYRIREDFDPERGSIKALLSSIARRRAVNLYRKAMRERAHTADTEAEQQASAASPAELASKAEERRMLLQAVAELDEPDREIIVRKYYLAESTKSIAKRLGMKPSAVDTRAHRIVLKLKNKLGGMDENRK